MREILGRRRKLTFKLKLKLLSELPVKLHLHLPARWRPSSASADAVSTYAGEWKWRLVPGVGFGRPGSGSADPDAARLCACPRPDCPVPGVHPHDPGLLAATRDPRMTRWWWTTRPEAPVILATGDRVSAVSLPAVAGERALEALGRLGVRTGPVVATPTRFVLLVAPYELDQLGELLDRQEWVPSSLRYHGQGGYVALPPGFDPGRGGDAVEPRWVRPPAVDPGSDSPWLPSVELIVDTLVRAGRTAPDGSRLTY